ncbi:MAG TPA: ATP phosphoribosyltransferase regulatory subunit, partial [Anaerolineae bacterium]
ALREAIRRKNTPTLMQLLDVLNLDAAPKRALAQLPTLSGGVTVLDRAECVNADARAAIEHLRAVVARLTLFGLNDSVTLDLSENRGMEYYTGILFEGFAQGLGFAVASGGRYDNLIAHFGPRIPAVGFAIGVERVLLALRSRGATRVTIAPEVIAQEYAGRVAAARAEGRIVEVDVLDRDDNALREYARMRGAREIWWRDGRTESVMASHPERKGLE